MKRPADDDNAAPDNSKRRRDKQARGLVRLHKNRDRVLENRDLRNRNRGREHQRDGRYPDAYSRKRLSDDEHKLRENKYRYSGRYWPHKKRDGHHWSDKKLEEMNERDWSIFLEESDISLQGLKIPRPLMDWADSKMNAELLKALRRAGYRQPTALQRAAIPPALEQRDVIGIAGPFYGKTAAFVIPMLSHISRLPRISEVNEAEGPYAVVMAPTRELAEDFENETIDLAYYLGIKVVSIVGCGESLEEQGSGVGRGCEVVIATPSRLLDCLERRYVVLNQCSCVILGEADRMIEMGFEPKVVGVLEAMPNSNLKPENEDAELDEKKIYRSTYMFSSTMPPALEQLNKKYLRNPVVVTIGNPVFTNGPKTDFITMDVVMMKESEKYHRLTRLLDELGDKTAMVFVNTKINADNVAKSLDKAGYRVTPLHGGTKRCNVLVSTDFGEGVDVPEVDHVINYDMPGNIKAYVHRIERTFCAGKFGVATTFLALSDRDVFYAFKRLLREHGSVVPPELDRHEASNIIPDRPVSWKDTVFAH